MLNACLSHSPLRFWGPVGAQPPALLVGAPGGSWGSSGLLGVEWGGGPRECLLSAQPETRARRVSMGPQGRRAVSHGLLGFCLLTPQGKPEVMGSQGGTWVKARAPRALRRASSAPKVDPRNPFSPLAPQLTPALLGIPGGPGDLSWAQEVTGRQGTLLGPGLYKRNPFSHHISRDPGRP